MFSSWPGGAGTDRSRTALVERRIRRSSRSHSFDFKAIPALNKAQVLECLPSALPAPARPMSPCGLAACQRGLSTGFTTAAALVHELMEARDERRLLRLQKQMVACKLLIIDELGFVPLSTGAELQLISYERGATLITSNLPFDPRPSAPRDRGTARPSHPFQYPRDERRQPASAKARPQKQCR